MTLPEIIMGESKNVEFKMELPKKSDKYTKSVIAFSNASGGKLIIGVDDKTRKVVGVDEKSVFQIMDSIANAVSDCCEPQIVPDITFQTIDNKCVVVVEIYPGANRPYYLKSKGKDTGTYIRVGGTSRLADKVRIKELEMEGANLSWDELTCIGYPVIKEAVSKLCNDIKLYMSEAVGAEDVKEIKAVSTEQLLNWKVLKMVEGELLATNAFVLLTSEYFKFSRIQCALFKGVERDRNYMDNSCVQVAVYDDRVEVTSPGMLYGGLTLEEAVSGRSKIRNCAVAEIFSRMEIIEEWGTGIQRIIKRAEEYGLPEPEFLEIGDTFRVVLYRKTDKKPIKICEKPINDYKRPIKAVREEAVLAFVEKNGSITNKEARELLGLAESTVKRFLKEMVIKGLLAEEGEKKARRYLK